MIVPIDLDCFTPDNRRAVILRVRTPDQTSLGQPPVRGLSPSLNTCRKTEWFLTVLSVSYQLRGGLRLPVFLIQSRTAFPLTRRAVRAGRGDALRTSRMRSLGSFPFHALQHVRQDQSERFQSKTSIHEPIGEAHANRRENLNGKIIFQEVRNVF